MYTPLSILNRAKSYFALNGDSRSKAPIKAWHTEGHPKILVLLGGNCSGKTLLTKIAQQLALEQVIECLPVASMYMRTQGGIHRAFMYNGSESDSSTGALTVSCFLSGLSTSRSRSRKHAVLLDEPEIGCSEELQMGIGAHLAEYLKNLPDLCEMVILTTHSRRILAQVAPLKPTIISLGSKFESIEQWLNRNVESVDPTGIGAKSIDLFRAVHAIVKKNKGNRK